MFSCYFLKCPYHHHLSPPITSTYHHLRISPITRWRGSRGRARSTSPAVACRRYRCYRPRRPWVGSRPGAGVPLRVGTGRAGVSAMTRRANRGKRRGGMEREVRSGRVSWYLDGDSPSNGRVSARHSSSTMSRSCPATITVASEPLISPSRGCVVSLVQTFGQKCEATSTADTISNQLGFPRPLASVHIDARVFNLARASPKLAHGRSSSVQSGCDLDPRVHVPNPPRSVLIARCPRSN